MAMPRPLGRCPITVDNDAWTGEPSTVRYVCEAAHAVGRVRRACAYEASKHAVSKYTAHTDHGWSLSVKNIDSPHASMLKVWVWNYAYLENRG